MRVIVIRTKLGNIQRRDTSGLLYDLQWLVDGFIEPCAPVQLREQGIELLCNEEGLLRHLPANENLFPFFYVGTVVAIGVGEDEFVGLTEEQEAFVLEWLSGLGY